MSAATQAHQEAYAVAFLKFKREYGHVLTGDEECQRMIFLAGFSAGLSYGVDSTLATSRKILGLPEKPMTREEIVDDPRR